jgi:hypothetical protein
MLSKYPQIGCNMYKSYLQCFLRALTKILKSNSLYIHNYIRRWKFFGITKAGFRAYRKKYSRLAKVGAQAYSA